MAKAVVQKSSAHFSTAALALLEAVAWSEEDEEESGEGGKRGGTGGAGGPNFKDLVKSVRSNWKQMLGGELLSILKEFGLGTRASANLVVSWVGDFTVIQDIFDEIESLVLDKDRDRNRKRGWWKQWRKKSTFTKG